MNEIAVYFRRFSLALETEERRKKNGIEWEQKKVREDEMEREREKERARWG